MKQRNKFILSITGTFIVGVLIGGVVIFYYSADMTGRMIGYYATTYTNLNAIQNTKRLQKIRQNKLPEAIEALESDLDSNIISLHNLLKDQEVLSEETKEAMRSTLKSAKRYRREYPRSSKDSEIDKSVNEAFSQI